MPIFSYRCESCGKMFDELIFSAAAEKSLSCPSCGGTSLKRQLAPFAVGKSSPAAEPGCGQGRCSSCAFGDN
ncbi:MAG: zinc ribbon domain-containing protein [candidate division Zixibacteria bacterium]|nr:zinc ribbon domain-containing protein [candidate division Zixibacteria bacterium]